jgi:hypothetical protein
MKKLILSAVAICLLSFTMGGAQSSQKIDPRIVGDWRYEPEGYDCEKYTFRVDGSGGTSSDCALQTSFNFTTENGKIRFYNNTVCWDDVGCSDGKPFEHSFSFSSDGKTLTLAERIHIRDDGTKVKIDKKTLIKLNPNERFCDC